MPVHVAHDPFAVEIDSSHEALRIPQARLLQVLMPAYPEDPPCEWPLVTRTMLGMRAGYTAISGTVTRALNGIRATNRTSGDPHPGIIERGFIEVVTVNVEGVNEVNYRITKEGIQVFQEFLSHGGSIPPVKDAQLCVNDRYLTDE